MTLLKDILYKVALVSTSGDMGISIANVQFDSRKVRKGDLFVAVRGTQTDGHKYIATAIKSGAAAVVCEDEIAPVENVTIVRTADSAAALGIIASNFYGNPSEKLTLVGVTGTNGKTTIVNLLYQLFKSLGYNAGMLSTIHNLINDEVIPATHTTGDALQINRLLKKMADAGCTHCFMEASSHAIHQRRVAGLQYDVAIFTNITHDHLDYHKTFDEYINAKKMLFDDLRPGASALVNRDDKRSMVMLQNTRADKKTFGIKRACDFKAKILSDSLDGLELEIDNQKIWFKLIGDFNAYNILAAYGTAVILGEDPHETLVALSSAEPVTGRFERVPLKNNVIAIIDYAHTPDALTNVLKTINKIRTRNEQLTTVVGCGGNRDREKRPLMGEIASRMSDKVIFTSDNPRDEDPAVIIEEMLKGVRPSNFKKVLTIIDRREAIKTSLMLSKGRDIILIAGKGHEDYQEIKGEKKPFSDRQVLLELEALLSDENTDQG